MIASNFYSYRNIQQASAGSNLPKKASVETTTTPSTANTLSQAPVLAHILTLYTRKDLQRITKLCMDSFFWENCQERPRQGQMKARFLDLYYKKSHIEYYHFCQ